MPLLVVLFIVVPIVELAVILQVGSLIGFWPTVGLLIADSILGSVLMRSQGRAAWRNFNAALGSGRPPAREVLDGVLVIFGGALLLTPGFVTDIAGLLFLLPPTRAVVRRVLARHAQSRIVTGLAGAGAGRRPPRARPADLEGSARDVPPPNGRPRL